MRKHCCQVTKKQAGSPLLLSLGSSPQAMLMRHAAMHSRNQTREGWDSVCIQSPLLFQPKWATVFIWISENTHRKCRARPEFSIKCKTCLWASLSTQPIPLSLGWFKKLKVPNDISGKIATCLCNIVLIIKTTCYIIVLLYSKATFCVSQAGCANKKLFHLPLTCGKWAY